MQTKFCSMSLNKWIQLNFSLSICWHTHIYTEPLTHRLYTYIRSFVFSLFIFLSCAHVYSHSMCAVCTVHVHTITGFAMPRRDELMKFLSSFIVFFWVGRLSLDCVSSPSTQQPLTPHIIALTMGVFGFNFKRFPHTIAILFLIFSLSHGKCDSHSKIRVLMSVLFCSSFFCWGKWHTVGFLHLVVVVAFFMCASWTHCME